MKLYLLAPALASLSISCEAPRPIHDYQRFYERQPQTVLVLPVINKTTSAEAPAAFSSTISSPLIQRGYSVLPVLPSAELLRTEGIYEGEEVAIENLRPFKDLIGADSVLRVTIHDWETVYMVLASAVEVEMTYELFDTETGEILWETSGRQSLQSDSSGSILTAVVNAAITAASTRYVDLARRANIYALTSLPAGPFSVHFERDRTQYLAAQVRRDEQAKSD